MSSSEEAPVTLGYELVCPFYDDEGNLESIEEYEDGILYFRSFNRYGSMLSEDSYDDDGGYHGVCRSWHDVGVEQGPIRTEYTFEHSRSLGDHFEYYLDGTLKTKWTYDDGGFIVHKEEWYTPDQPKKICSYGDEEKNGEYKSWYPNGQVKEDSFYEEGERVGYWVIYDRDGNVKGQNKSTNKSARA